MPGVSLSLFGPREFSFRDLRPLAIIMTRRKRIKSFSRFHFHLHWLDGVIWDQCAAFIRFEVQPTTDYRYITIKIVYYQNHFLVIANSGTIFLLQLYYMIPNFVSCHHRVQPLTVLDVIYIQIAYALARPLPTCIYTVWST